jgi:hypothetical protein
MADTMVIEGDDTMRDRTMRREEDQASVGKAGTRRPASVLPSHLVRKYINGRPSDAEGLKQLLFHLACAIGAAWCVKYSRDSGSWLLLAASEMAMGLVASFYFAGFHEMIHNTAFATRWLNKSLAHVTGFFIFRGANWYWYFHWYHHRFTNDPKRDPELSGTTVDRTDPTTQASGTLSKLGAFAVFLSGWPFGFERIPGIARYALGTCYICRTPCTDACVVEGGRGQLATHAPSRRAPGRWDMPLCLACRPPNSRVSLASRSLLRPVRRLCHARELDRPREQAQECAA